MQNNMQWKNTIYVYICANSNACNVDLNSNSYNKLHNIVTCQNVVNLLR